jgi:hypothetical protein
MLFVRSQDGKTLKRVQDDVWIGFVEKEDPIINYEKTEYRLYIDGATMYADAQEHVVLAAMDMVVEHMEEEAVLSEYNVILDLSII